MTKLLSVNHAAEWAKENVGGVDMFEGFLTATSTDKFTVVTAVDGSVLQIDAAPGGVAIKSAAATAGNEDCYLVREAECFKPAAGKPIEFWAIVQATEDDTNQNNLIVGLTDAAAADLLVNDGAGPKTSGSTIAFFKKDGGLNWWVHASLSTTQTSVELSAANSLDKTAHVGSGSADQLLEFHVLPKTSALADIEYYIDGVLVYKISDWTYTGVTDMQRVAGVKDGDSADEVTLNLRAWYCGQKRYTT